MPLFTPAELPFLQAVSRLAYSNPFLPERITFERQALGPDFAEALAVWNLHPDREAHQPNVDLIRARVERVADEAVSRLAAGSRPGEEELRLYEDLILFLLYHRYLDEFRAAIERSERIGASQTASRESACAGKPARRRIGFYAAFARDAERYLALPGIELPAVAELPHLFACLFQVRRAFHHTFRYIIGVSAPAVRLRAEVWQSIFTHDMRRYRRTLYHRMGDITTLITGPSGTGKELVARAIGLSRYVPFDPQKLTFEEEPANAFFALNLSAMSPTLIESELFGHRRGAFTGAVEDRVGWLEVCPALGTVFLDEIGDLDPGIQVKLLRVLQERTFQRLGESREHRFEGKIISATNRDLAGEMARRPRSAPGGWNSPGAENPNEARGFRADFYYRLCADMIETPTLEERLRDSPEELGHLLQHIVRREFGPDTEPIAQEVQTWIEERLGPGYPWPGNVRELAQCVRNVLIRKEYHPPRAAGGDVAIAAAEELAGSIQSGTITADDLLRRYCTIVYAQTRNYGETARRLGIDRRTVKSKIDAELMEEL